MCLYNHFYFRNESSFSNKIGNILLKNTHTKQNLSRSENQTCLLIKYSHKSSHWIGNQIASMDRYWKSHLTFLHQVPGALAVAKSLTSCEGRCLCLLGAVAYPTESFILSSKDGEGLSLSLGYYRPLEDFCCFPTECWKTLTIPGESQLAHMRR